jgi:hypothetical protein
MVDFKSQRLLKIAVALFLTFSIKTIGILAQGPPTTPANLTVAGVKLGDRNSAKAFLAGYQPRTSDGFPTYYFYNKYATSVMKLTASSFEDPYFVTKIEVFAVGKDYKDRHFYLDNIGYFETESGIYIGSRQSGRGMAASLIIGIPYPLGVNSINPKDIVRKNGEPSERSKSGDAELLDYRLDTINLNGENVAKFGYAARFEFHKRKLQRYSIMLVPK